MCDTLRKKLNLNVGDKVVINEPGKSYNGWEAEVVFDECDCSDCAGKLHVKFDKAIVFGFEIFSAGCPWVFEEHEIIIRR